MTDPTTAPGDEQTATLLVDRTSSTCGGCGKPTLPSALTHADVSGYDPKPGGGCGARYTAIRSVNRGVTEENLRSLRPDLPVDTGREQQATERPYTDADLRAEAARQHSLSLEDPDFMGIGERMDGTSIPSTVVDLEPETGEPLEMSRAWSHLSREDFDAAQRSIDDLLTSAADVSEWAINLGADGLEPSDEHVITLDGDGKPIIRVHFAFAPGMPEEMRDSFMQGIGKAIDAHL